MLTKLACSKFSFMRGGFVDNIKDSKFSGHLIPLNDTMVLSNVNRRNSVHLIERTLQKK